MLNRFCFLLLVLPFLLLNSCTNYPWESIEIQKTKPVAYLSTIDLMRQKGTTAFGSSLLLTKNLDSDLINYLFSYCYRIPRPTEKNHTEELNALFANPFMKKLNDELILKNKQVPKHIESIKTGINRLYNSLPNVKLPQTIYCVNSFFSGSSFCTDKSIILGLERYLGENSPSIQALPGQDFPLWNKKMMDMRYLERDAIASWCYSTIIEDKSDNGNFAEQLVQWGKILFLTKMALPQQSDNILLRYPEDSYNWAIEHERLIWDFIVKNGFLFKRSEREQANWFKEGPFTAGLPNKAPDRLGQFIGWRIILSYLEQNDITPEELIQLPYTELLQAYEIND